MASMVAAVQVDLDRLASRDDELANGALAQLALAMAREIDAAANSATSKSMCAGRLIEALEQLRALAPAQEEEDEVERARQRRAERLAG